MSIPATIPAAGAAVAAPAAPVAAVEDFAAPAASRISASGGAAIAAAVSCAEAPADAALPAFAPTPGTRLRAAAPFDLPASRPKLFRAFARAAILFPARAASYTRCVPESSSESSNSPTSADMAADFASTFARSSLAGFRATSAACRSASMGSLPHLDLPRLLSAGFAQPGSGRAAACRCVAALSLCVKVDADCPSASFTVPVFNKSAFSEVTTSRIPALIGQLPRGAACASARQSRWLSC